MRKIKLDSFQHQQLRKGSASHDLSSHVDFTYESESKYGAYESIQMSDFTSTDFETDSNQNLSIQIQSLIGQGKFAKIWKGILVKDGFQRTVAVKIFSAAEQKSWTQESELYTDLSVCLRHSNILEYIGSEERIRGTLKQYWLVTAFHEQGSLRDYLSKNMLSWNELCTMGKSIFSGAAYMHSYAFGQDYLPKIPVAHRDIKSSNILVKIDGTCAIADFGLALKLDPTASIADLANSGQAGTARYMSPEALDSKINLNDIESFKQCDMYALSLVMWEIMSRCSILSDVGDYTLPYSDRVGSDPTIEAMKGVILRDKYRPEVPPSWKEHKGMRALVDTMIDCWDEDPEARLTSSCIESRFCNLSRLDDADFDIFTEDARLLDDFDSGMASSMSQVTSSHDSTSVSSPQHSPTKHPKLGEKRSITSSEFSDESGLMSVDIASPSHKGRYISRGYIKSINSDITEENEVIELASDDDLPAFPESIAISFD
ncbi:TGF-beta receptor type-2-like [Ptychodera flava]|uniref:TGF-beta receptor type-2-like n=1 Tax=Ptychodera flava TaxID=63121 RepID=UPI00396A9FA4